MADPVPIKRRVQFPIGRRRKSLEIPLVCRILVTNTNSHHIYLSLTDQGQAYQNESVTLLYVFCFLPILIYVYYRGYSLRPPDCRRRAAALPSGYLFITQ